MVPRLVQQGGGDAPGSTLVWRGCGGHGSPDGALRIARDLPSGPILDLPYWAGELQNSEPQTRISEHLDKSVATATGSPYNHICPSIIPKASQLACFP